MARFYADEQFPFPVVELLRNWEQFAVRIGEAVTGKEPLSGKLIRVVRPAS